MKELFEDLRLNGDVLKQRCEYAVGYGRAYKNHSIERADRQLVLLAAATSFRRAAADCLLLEDANQARELFQEAANAYLEAGSPFGVVISQLGSDVIPASFNVGSERTLVASDVFALFGAQSTKDLDEKPELHLSRRFNAVRSERIGILGIQVSRYLDLLNASARNDKAALREALFPFLTAYNDAFAIAISDTFHWSRQAIPFHPLEPEILAILVAVFRRRGSLVVEIFESSGMNRLALACMQQALIGYVGSPRGSRQS